MVALLRMAPLIKLFYAGFQAEFICTFLEPNHILKIQLGNIPFANQQIFPDKKGEGLPEWLTVCW